MRIRHRRSVACAGYQTESGNFSLTSVQLQYLLLRYIHYLAAVRSMHGW